jgi:hypothetical protein
MKRTLSVFSVVLALAACTDPVAPPQPSFSVTATPQELFARYVALGTSNSMGVQSAGIFAAGQRAAWPAQLAARVGVPFSLPLIQDPGCPPPLFAPLAADLALLGLFAAFGAGDDLVDAVGGICKPPQPGVTLPANSVAISGAKARDALHGTPETKGVLYSRVLPPGHTQVSAMLAQQPTFVSVELAANEVLPASTGRLEAMTPFADWTRDYDEIIGAVQSTGAHAVLVGVPSDATNFPSVRTAREFFNQWPYLLALGIGVSFNCYFSSNYLFIPGYVLTLLSRAPTTATCKNVPGAVDYVLTASEMSTINDRLADMNAYIQSHANANGYAYFSLDAVYGLPKPGFDMGHVLFSSTPFGPYMSLDGVHPNAQGQSLLAAAAVESVNARYGVAIP